MRVQRSKAEVMKDLREKLRKYKGNFAAADMFDPTDTTVPADETALKAWAQAGRMAAMNLARNLERQSQKRLLDQVEEQFRAVYDKATPGCQPAEILAEFDAWKEYPGEEAWEFFKAQQAGVSVPATEALDAKVKLAEIAGSGGRAQSMAVEMRNKFPRGPNAGVGTVCAGLADSKGGVWGGTSGHGATLHPLMSALLSGVRPVEEWPVEACGEVHAMNQYLNAHTFTSLNDIPKGKLYSHAETWEKPAGPGLNGKWKSRGACLNCEQWLDKLEVNLV